MEAPPIFGAVPPAQPRLEFVVSHPPLAYVYDAFTPTISINGHKESRPWGIHIFNLAPGEYTISASYPWLFSKECGKGILQVRLGAGDVVRVTYVARMIRYVPGKMTVERVRAGV